MHVCPGSGRFWVRAQVAVSSAGRSPGRLQPTGLVARTLATFRSWTRHEKFDHVRDCGFPVRLVAIARVVVFGLALVGCVHPQVGGRPQSPTKRLATSGPWYGDLHALAEEAATARGLVLTVRFEVEALPDDAFFAQLQASSRRKSQPLSAELTKTLSAFGLNERTPLLGATNLTHFKRTQTEQVIAFYVFDTHRLYVRATRPPLLADADAEALTLLLAHEVGHALQDQQGVGARTPATFDAALTWRAVLEGDATLTATLLLAKRHHVTPTRAVERVRLSTSMLSDEQLLAFSGMGGDLLSASPVVRELFLFPYLRGQRFIADLYHAGGLTLVDAVLKAPPTRSDAILTPQRFLEGGPPQLEGGKRRVGAAMLRLLFEHCFPREAKGAAAWVDRHYLDDAFEAEDGRLEWVTAWQAGEPSAKQRFEPARAGEVDPDAAPADRLQALMRCLGAKPTEFEIAEHNGVLGLASKTADNAAAAQRLAATRLRPEAAPPFGVHPLVRPSVSLAYRSAGPGITAQGQWTHQRLGLRLPLAPGDTALPNAAAALTLGSSDRSLLMVVFVDERPTPKFNDGFLNGVLASLLSPGGHAPPPGFSLVQRHTWVATHSRQGETLEATAPLDLPAGRATVRARVFPMCDGEASLAVVGVSPPAIGEATVERWLSELENDGSNPAMCLEP